VLANRIDLEDGTHAPGRSPGRMAGMVAAGIAVVVGFGGGAPARAGLAEELDAVATGFHEAGELNGVVAVARDGELVLARAYGIADLDTGRASTVETPFYLASVTKVFTATLVMQLVDEGRVGLDDTLDRHLPGLRPDLARRITIEQLLSHSSGVTRDLAEFVPGGGPVPGDVAGCIEILNRLDPDFEPGSRYGYSNAGYTLLAGVIESVTGRPYRTVLGERILEPVGMTATVLPEGGDLPSDRAIGYDRSTLLTATAASPGAGGHLGAGGIWSTALDLLRLDEALRAGTLLTAESRGAMAEQRHGRRGLGWIVDHPELGGEARLLVRHSGRGLRSGAVLFRYPEDGVAVVVLQNDDWVSWNVARQLSRVVFGDPPDEAPRDPVARTLLTTLVEEDVDAALAFLGTLPDDPFPRRVVGPRQATGPPDSPPGDMPTAWASRTPDGDREWLETYHTRPVDAVAVVVYENQNPGAVVGARVWTAADHPVDLDLAGASREMAPHGVEVLRIPVEVADPVWRVRLDVDSPSVPGWNEIDAVGLVDGDGIVHWADDATASSTGADGVPLRPWSVPHRDDLVEVARRLLDEGHPTWAIRVHELVRRAYPATVASSTAYAEALAAAGRSEEARRIAAGRDELAAAWPDVVRQRLRDAARQRAARLDHELGDLRARTVLGEIERVGLSGLPGRAPSTDDASSAPGEHELNHLGYELLGTGRVTDAIHVFELAVHLYPDSWNAHDSLGEGYLRTGRREDGLRAYRRSLALNPDNAGARRILGE